MDVENVWLIPPTDLSLPSDEIHIWRAALDSTLARIGDFHQTLSEREREKARRFHFERDRWHYSIRHGILRIILSRYLGIEPDRLSFCEGEFGKLYLQDGMNPIQLQFNLSFSHQIVVYAFSRGREIGVDLEYVHPIVNLRDVAAKFFSQNESRFLSTLPDEQALQAFYDCWTRKEAYIKATGKGLKIRLDHFKVSLMPGKPARLVSVSGEPQEVDRWQLLEFTPERDYVVAVAVEGFKGKPRLWQWR